jgi:hypothetical protein
MTRQGFLPQVSVRLGQNGGPSPAASPGPSSSPAPSGGNTSDTGTNFGRFPFFPTFFSGPSYPFYWNQPYFYPPAEPARPRYICKKTEEEDGEERFICEPEQPAVPRQPVLYVRPYSGSFFF